MSDENRAGLKPTLQFIWSDTQWWHHSLSFPRATGWTLCSHMTDQKWIIAFCQCLIGWPSAVLKPFVFYCWMGLLKALLNMIFSPKHSVMSSVVISDHHLPGVAAHLAGDPGPGLLPADVATADLAPVLPDDEHFLHLPGCMFTIFLGTVQHCWFHLWAHLLQWIYSHWASSH